MYKPDYVLVYHVFNDVLIKGGRKIPKQLLTTRLNVAPLVRLDGMLCFQRGIN